MVAPRYGGPTPCCKPKNMRKSESCIGLRHLFTQIRRYSPVRQCSDASSKSKFALFFASLWRWRWGAACVACKLEASVGCFPSLCCSHFLPPVDSQAVLSVRRRQHILAWQQQVYQRPPRHEIQAHQSHKKCYAHQGINSRKHGKEPQVNPKWSPIPMT